MTLKIINCNNDLKYKLVKNFEKKINVVTEIIIH